MNPTLRPRNQKLREVKSFPKATQLGSVQADIYTRSSNLDSIAQIAKCQRLHHG